MTSKLTREPITHELKIYPEFFSAVCTGVKRAELRKNDRDYRVGDSLHLLETPRGSCHSTGEFISATITHIADVSEWMPGYVLLSIELQARRKAAMDSEPVAWGNGCDKTVPAALRYLAENERPFGGESRFNAAHLYQLAREIELMAEDPLYRHAQQPVVRPAPECQHQWRYGGANKLQKQKQCIKCGRVELDAQQPIVPATLPCSVELKPGLIIGKGCKTETLLTALRSRADYNADIDAMTPEERAEHDASIKAFKAMLPEPAPVVDADDNFYSWFGREWHENYQHNQYTTAAKQMLGVMAESAWKAGHRAAMLRAGNSPVIPDSARDALLKALAAMEFMGDALNNLDAVCTEDVEFVAPAFDAVRSVLAAAPQETSVNDVTTGEPLTITLPDISSKAFWSGAGKNETFHPETYRRWVKEAVERACIIASIDVEVK